MSSGPFDVKSSIAAQAIFGAICIFNVVSKFSRIDATNYTRKIIKISAIEHETDEQCLHTA